MLKMIIKKITKEPITNIALKDKRSSRSEDYRLNEMIVFGNKNDNLYSDIKPGKYETLAKICSYGIQPITGIVSRLGDMDCVMFDGVASHVAMIEMIIDADTIKLSANNPVLQTYQKVKRKQSTLLCESNVLRFIWGRTNNGLNSNSAIINQRYLSNHKYVSLFNAVMFNEYKWFSQLEDINAKDEKEIYSIIKNHKSIVVDEQVIDDFNSMMELDYVRNKTKLSQEDYEKSIEVAKESFKRIPEIIQTYARRYNRLSSGYVRLKLEKTVSIKGDL